MRLVLALVVALASTGCATALVAAEGAIHRSIAVTQDTANAVCDAQLQTAESCRAFNVKLVPVIASAKTFNRAVRENSAAEIPAMLSALAGLREAVGYLIQLRDLFTRGFEQIDVLGVLALEVENGLLQLLLDLRIIRIVRLGRQLLDGYQRSPDASARLSSFRPRYV